MTGEQKIWYILINIGALKKNFGLNKIICPKNNIINL